MDRIRFPTAMPQRPGEYPSCAWIEGGIAFNRSSLHACLVAHHDTGLPFISAYRGGTVVLDEVMRAREEIRAANRNGGLPQCIGCAHLEKRRWQPGAYPVRIVGIGHYARCNMKCSYCFLQTEDPAWFADGLRPYSLLPALEALIASGALAPDAIIDWGGGEPTVYGEIDPILALLLAHGTSHYLHTNGTRIPGEIRRTRAPGRIHVICSIDAGLAATYRAIKQRDCLDLVWDNLAEYLRLGVKVTAKYIVTPANCADVELDAFLERAARIAIRDVIVDIDYNFPDPGPRVVTAIARLLHRAWNAGMHARFGFAGANFAVETGVAERVAAALQDMQAAAIHRLLEHRGYVSGAPLDVRVEQLVACLEAHYASSAREVQAKDAALWDLLSHCAAKDREIAAKEGEIQRLAGALTELRRPETLAKALAVAALSRLGLYPRRE